MNLFCALKLGPSFMVSWKVPNFCTNKWILVGLHSVFSSKTPNFPPPVQCSSMSPDRLHQAIRLCKHSEGIAHLPRDSLGRAGSACERASVVRGRGSMSVRSPFRRGGPADPYPGQKLSRYNITTKEGGREGRPSKNTGAGN